LIHIITAREYINISMELAHYIAQHKSWFLYYNRRQSSPISHPTIIIKRRQFFFKLLAGCACLATSFDEDKPQEQ
jgi:hypothetical protein